MPVRESSKTTTVSGLTLSTRRRASYARGNVRRGEEKQLREENEVGVGEGLRALALGADDEVLDDFLGDRELGT